MLVSRKSYVIFIQIIFIFALLYFISAISRCFQYKIFQANSSSIFNKPSEKALLITYSVKTAHPPVDENKKMRQIEDLRCERSVNFPIQCLKHGSLSQSS